MEYLTERLRLRLPEREDSHLILDYLLQNEEFLSEWEAKRSPEYFSQVNIDSILSLQIDEIRQKKGLYFYILPQDEEKVIGTIGFSNIVYGPFQSCFLSYKLSRGKINQGYITEALRKAIEICFVEWKLHRIEANILPRNTRSKRVVEKLDFEYEGLSKKYLKINGIWEDHEHYVLLNNDTD